MSSQMLMTPIGPITVFVSDPERLDRIIMGKASAEDREMESAPLMTEAIKQLKAFFTGKLKDFDLPLAPLASTRGGELRTAICAIPYGKTMSYGEVARYANSGPRAIGQACRRNPFPIVVPCHRVIGAAQSIGYYSGGDGIITKRWLIDHEQCHL